MSKMQILVGPGTVDVIKSEPRRFLFTTDPDRVLTDPSTTLCFEVAGVSVRIPHGKYTVQERTERQTVGDKTSEEELKSLARHLHIPEVAEAELLLDDLEKKQYIISPYATRAVRWRWYIITIEENN